MRRLLTLLVAVGMAAAGLAQKITRTFDDESLAAALRQLNEESADYTINFIYDELEDFRVSTSIKNKTLPEAIRQMIGFYPISMTIDDDESAAQGKRHRTIFVECVQKASRRYTGTVLGEQGRPLSYANVVLFSPADTTLLTGGVSNEAGRFVIPCEAQRVLMRVTCIGYKPVWREVDAEEVGIITLLPEQYVIDGITVKGQRPQYKMTSDGMVVNVQGTVLSEAGTANDVIAMLPGVESGDGKVSVVGKGEPLIYINGRQVRNASELGRLSSKEIDLIEYNTTPGAKYDATVQAVINIKTIKKAGDGLGGSARLWAKQGHYGSGSTQLSLNYRVNGLDIFGELEHSFYHNYQEQRNDNQSFTSTDHWQELQTLHIDSRHNELTATLGVNWQLSDDHSMGVRYNATNESLDSHFYWPMDETAYRNGEVVEQTHYDTRGQVSQPTEHQVNAYYNGKVGKLTIDSNNDYFFTGSGLAQNISETGPGQPDNTVNSRSNQRGRMWASKLVMGHPLASGTLEGGYEYTHTDRTDNYRNMQQLLPSADNHIKEQMAAGFLSYGIAFGKVEVGAGLRYEHVNSDYYSFGLYVPGQSRTYDRLFPNVSVSFPVGKAQLTLAYSEKTQRPGYWQLRSFVQYDSRYLYETGNPLLRPAVLRTLSLQGVYKWAYLSLNYKRVNDYITSIMDAYEEDSPINIMRGENLSHLTQYNAVLSLAPKIGRWSPTWRLYFSGQRYSKQTVGGRRSFNSPLVQPQWDNFIKLGHDFTLYAAANGRIGGYVEDVRIKPSWQANVGLSRQFGGWNFMFRLYDIFRSGRNKFLTYGYTGTFDKWNYSDSRNVQLTVTYRFNAARSKYKGEGAGNSEKNRL